MASETADKAEPAKTEAIKTEAIKTEGGNNTGGGRPRRAPREKTCYNCGQGGHIARDCTNPRLEGEDRQVINKARAQYRRCFNCGRMGHISADCSKPAGNKACYNCGQEGHIAKDCPNPKSQD